MLQWRMEEDLKEQTARADESFHPISEPSGMTAPTGGAADTIIAETARCIRQYPLSAVATAFGGGVLAGWLIAHNLKTRFYAGRKERQRASEIKANRRAISIWENEGGSYRG